jgi:adhesin/invasin
MLPARPIPSVVRRIRRRSLLVGATLVAALSAACGDDPASSTNPGSMSRVRGDSQTVAAGAALPAPMVVRVLAENGNPLSGTVVTWTLATSATGVLGGATSTTDASGEASMTFTSGTTAGTVSIGACTGALAGLTFTHTVQAGAASAIVKVAGDGAAGLVGTGIQLVVRATDSFGNPVSGVTVNWAAGTGGGVLSAASSTSDSAGLARVTLTLGATAGVYTATATSGSFAPVSFSVTAI